MSLLDNDSKYLEEYEGAILSWFRSRKGGDLGSASPRRLTKAMLSALDRAAVSWDDGDLIYPNVVQVSMGNDPWDHYYSQMLNDSECRFEKLIAEHVAQSNGIVNNLQVHLMLDPALLGSSVRVSVSFDERSTRPDAIEELTVRARSAAGSPSTVLYVNEGGVMTVESELGEDASLAEATVVFGQTQFPVFHDTTIGTLRYPAKPGPDVELPLASCPGTSQIHGRFLHDARANVWTFVNEGRNGTLVIHEGEGIRLGMSEKQALANGDQLVLGCREAKVSFASTEVSE